MRFVYSFYEILECHFVYCGCGIRTHDFQIMSLTSYLTALTRVYENGRSRTRTYEVCDSGFTARPLCRSGHSPFVLVIVCLNPVINSYKCCYGEEKQYQRSYQIACCSLKH